MDLVKKLDVGFEKHREDSVSSFKDDASVSGLSFF